MRNRLLDHILRVPFEDLDKARRSESYIKFCLCGIVGSLLTYPMALVTTKPLEVLVTLFLATAITGLYGVGILLTRKGWVDWAASIIGLMGTTFFLVASFYAGYHTNLFYYPAALALSSTAVLRRRFFLGYVGLTLTMYLIHVLALVPTPEDIGTVVTTGIIFGVVVMVNAVTSQTTNTYLSRAMYAEQLAHERLEQMEIASQHKDMFLANMSHELRTPLNTIMGYSKLVDEELEARGDAHGLRQDLSHVQSASEHLLALISDLLDLSKVRAGAVDIHPEPFEIRPLLIEIEKAALLRAKQQRTQIVLDLDHAPRTFASDKRLLTQILHNLVSNAVKFTHDGTVTLRARAHPGTSLCLVVEDTGIGMSQEALERVRGEFVQADITISRQYGGTGLGLSIVEHLVRTLGGDFTLASDLGVGTIATVTLPAFGPPSQADV